jgi:small subunit ribosomal protein S17
MSEPSTTAARRIVRKQGVVVSAKMAKTIVVRIDRMVRHAKYKKIIRRTTKAYAHDENRAAREGDVVEIEFTRPLSKNKRWVLVKVLKKGPEWKAEEAALDAAAVAAATGGEKS